jgi:general secretion pathway protein N
MALPGRLQWRIRPLWTLDGFPAWGMQVAHPGVLSHPLDFHLSRSAAGWTVKLQGGDSGNVPALSAPAAWLAGLGAPWNTLQLSGRLRLDLEEIQWPLAAAGASDARIGVRLQLLNAASRVSTLAVLGHYEFDIRGGPQAVLTLASRPGSALLLEGTGRWTLGGQVEFRGQASAAPGREEALSNLLNIIGRREGARSIIALGGASPPLPSPAPRE